MITSDFLLKTRSSDRSKIFFKLRATKRVLNLSNKGAAAYNSFLFSFYFTVTKVSKDDEDSLQAFMRNIKEGRALDTNTRSKLKAQLINLRKEVLMWHRLAELARPVSMPALERCDAAGVCEAACC